MVLYRCARLSSKDTLDGASAANASRTGSSITVSHFAVLRQSSERYHKSSSNFLNADSSYTLGGCLFHKSSFPKVGPCLRHCLCSGRAL
jgi:hypothetical protein